MKKGSSDNSYNHLNYQMCILSVIAICFVVIGHIRFGIVDMTEAGTFYGWFPYYSFHLPVFLFITGYFFKDPDIRSLGRFLLHKARTLLLPYYLITGAFLLLNLLLIHQGFTWPQPFSLSTWLLDPWTKLYTLSFGVPAWYLISLFLAEVYFACLRMLLKKLIRNSLTGEIICLLLCLALGIAALEVHNLPGVTQTASVYLRSVLMLFFMQAGTLYRRHLEARDRLGNVPYFLIIFLIQFLILIFSNNSVLSPGLYGLIGFEAFGYDYFLAGLTGVALYLRISRLLASIPGRNRLILFLGSNTLYIMSFHILGFFLLNALLSWLRNLPVFSVLLQDFSAGWWHSYLYYTMTDDPRMIPLYLLAGVGISSLLAWGIQKGKRAVLAIRHK